MEIKDIINVAAIMSSPVIAVCVTLGYQHLTEKRKDKHSQKIRLFLNLMAHRKYNSLTQQYIDSLNLIDVVFYDNPLVVKQWHVYFDYLVRQPFDAVTAHKFFLDLLAEMAIVLGYQNLKQTTMDSAYIPQGHVDNFELQANIQYELLRVLKNSHSYAETKSSTNNPV